MDNPIKKLQENLARDLVSLEDTDMVSEQQHLPDNFFRYKCLIKKRFEM